MVEMHHFMWKLNCLHFYQLVNPSLNPSTGATAELADFRKSPQVVRALEEELYPSWSHHFEISSHSDHILSQFNKAWTSKSPYKNQAKFI